MHLTHNTKGVIAGFFAAATALWGWLGWLSVIFVACLCLDWLTGTMVAGKHRKWSSSVARNGLWRKAGTIVAVLTSAIADGVLGLLVNNVPGQALPFEYSVLICPLVLAWYILTELGSIIENVELLGAPVPSFLRKFISVCKINVERINVPDNENEEGGSHPPS